MGCRSRALWGCTKPSWVFSAGEEIAGKGRDHGSLGGDKREWLHVIRLLVSTFVWPCQALIPMSQTLNYCVFSWVRDSVLCAWEDSEGIWEEQLEWHQQRATAIWNAAVTETWGSMPVMGQPESQTPVSGGIHIVCMCKSTHVFPTNGPLPWPARKGCLCTSVLLCLQMLSLSWSVRLPCVYGWMHVMHVLQVCVLPHACEEHVLSVAAGWFHGAVTILPLSGCQDSASPQTSDTLVWAKCL